PAAGSPALHRDPERDSRPLLRSSALRSRPTTTDAPAPGAAKRRRRSGERLPSAVARTMLRPVWRVGRTLKYWTKVQFAGAYTLRCFAFGLSRGRGNACTI